ncbi:MAG: ABC transporter permease [Ignisphaera sp.]|nr:ABC transporter permease [Ignisphaera sp.]MDW8086316.1 ABC transporter permease [Ignisphaera sp.]
MMLRTWFKEFTKPFRVNAKLGTGSFILIMLIFIGLTSIMAPPWFEQWYKYPKDLPPSPYSGLEYILGTTTNGRSVYWSLTRGILNSLAISFITALIASHVGLLVGIIAGLKGGIVDKVLMTVTDVFIVIPAFPLYALLAMMLRRVLNIVLIGVIVAVTSWCWPARQVRAIVLSLREREFMLTAALSGLKTWEVVFKEVMLHLLGWHMVNFTNTVIYSIGSEVGLAIFGLSVLDKDTLGTMIYWAQGYGALYRGMWWWILSPIMIVVVLFLSLFLISIGLTEYLSRKR